MNTPPDKCPHCGAEKSQIQPEQENDSYRSIALDCGSWWTSGPGSQPRVGRVAGCYERELATLHEELASVKTSIVDLGCGHEPMNYLYGSLAATERCAEIIKECHALRATADQHSKLCLAELGGDGVWPCGCHSRIIDSYGFRENLTVKDGPEHEECEEHARLRADNEALRELMKNNHESFMHSVDCANAAEAECKTLKSDNERLREELTRVVSKADATVELLKACEYIAEGDLDWERLRNECPSTAAVSSLRDQLAAATAREAEMRGALKWLRGWAWNIKPSLFEIPEPLGKAVDAALASDGSGLLDAIKEAREALEAWDGRCSCFEDELTHHREGCTELKFTRLRRAALAKLAAFGGGKEAKP